MSTAKKPAARKPAAKDDPAKELTPIPRKVNLDTLDKDALVALAAEKGIDTTGLLTLELRAKLREG